MEIWQESEFTDNLWSGGPRGAQEYLLVAAQALDQQHFGEFVVVMWEIWNERNRVIFKQREMGMRRNLAARAVQFVSSYREFNEQSTRPLATKGSCWRPPDTGIHKLNFDAGSVGVNLNGWGFVIRNHTGDVVLAGVKQNVGFSSPEEEEARACHYALHTTLSYGYRHLVVEGDCQALVSKLHKKVVPNNSLGFFISDILSLSGSFDYIAWNFVKRGV